MGEHNVSQESDEKRQRKFMRALLSDVWALEQMLNTNRIESGVRRIGAEQEMFLVTPDMRPAPIVSGSSVTSGRCCAMALPAASRRIRLKTSIRMFD